MNFLHCGKFKVQLGLQTRIMGILNVTPDSFSDGGRHHDRHEAAAHAIRMEEEGADFIDIGGESSRPGASPVSTEEELRRILPVLEALIPRINIPVSIDTCKPEVARKAIQAGASMINDIQGLKNPKMAEVAAEYRLPAVLMHMQNQPETMQLNPAYGSVVSDLLLFFKQEVERAVSSGISREQIVIDPGIGFGKTAAHNLQILRSLEQFHSLGLPVLIGTSNKSFIGKILDLPVEKRLAGSLATVAWAVWKGVHIVRVHEVGPTKNVIQMIDAIRTAEESPGC